MMIRGVDMAAGGRKGAGKKSERVGESSSSFHTDTICDVRQSVRPVVTSHCLTLYLE